MTAEDSIYIPFPGTVLKQTETISAIDTIVYYDRSIAGCNKIKCPCRVWPQCGYYNKTKWKKSSIDDEHIDEIRKWYETHFRIKFETPDAFPNG